VGSRRLADCQEAFPLTEERALSYTAGRPDRHCMREEVNLPLG